MTFHVISSALLMLVGIGVPVAAQAQAASGEELYHVRFVKAVPGQLEALQAAEVKAPADPDNPERPVILRHAQGDDWQLLVISPIGKDETIRADQPNAALQQYFDQARSLSVRHDDSITQGPAWAEAKKVLGDTGGVFIVSTFESIPGHRDQLLAALKESPAGSSTLLLTHREGASWTFLVIERYASWSALGESMQKQATAGASSASAHFAAHHDTIAWRVATP